MTNLRSRPYASTILTPGLTGVFLFIVFAVASLPVSLYASAQVNIDMMGTVGRVIDGDTLDLVSIGRVRLADIDTPEIGSPGAQDAANYLAGLVLNRYLYLDTDAMYGTDRYDRIVAMAYARHNTTHLLNVNQALLQANIAHVANFPNEFNPADWTLYILYPTEQSPIARTSATIWAAFIVVVGATIWVFLLAAFAIRGLRH